MTSIDCKFKSVGSVLNDGCHPDITHVSMGRLSWYCQYLCLISVGTLALSLGLVV